MVDRVDLLDRQRDLLVDLVEASRRQPGPARRKFLLAITDHGDKLLHPGLPGGQIASSADDIEALADNGLVKTTRPLPDTISFFLTPLAVAYYQEVKTTQGEPVARVELDARRIVDAERFRQRYPAAHKKWTAAETLLWQNSDADLSRIGRLCREAMGAFASTLVQRFTPADISAMRGDSVQRIKAVIDQHQARTAGERVRLLEALLAYWVAVADLVQRQEQGPAVQADSAAWEDARSIVFQTLVVFTELDRSLPA